MADRRDWVRSVQSARQARSRSQAISCKELGILFCGVKTRHLVFLARRTETRQESRAGLGSGRRPCGILDVSMMMSFYHKRTFLDAHLLTQKRRILQKFSGQAGGGRAQAIADHWNLRTDNCLSTADERRGTRFLLLGTKNRGKKRSESRQGRKNTSGVSSTSRPAPTSCAVRQGGADGGRRPGTSEAAVRGRFTAFGQQHGSRGSRSRRQG